MRLVTAITSDSEGLHPRPTSDARRRARAAALLAPLLLAACVGYATPERTVLWTPVGTYTSEPAPEDP